MDHNRQHHTEELGLSRGKTRRVINYDFRMKTINRLSHKTNYDLNYYYSMFINIFDLF